MTPDEARAMARAIAHAFPGNRWTPSVVEQWETDLQKLSVPAAEITLDRLRARLIDPPTWSQFIGEARHHDHQPTPQRDPGLDLEGHRQAIAALRAQHKFLTK